MTAAALATIELPPPRRQRMRAGTPAVYFVALVVIALMLGPVLYIILGGFRTNSADHDGPRRAARTRGSGRTTSTF